MAQKLGSNDHKYLVVLEIHHLLFLYHLTQIRVEQSGWRKNVLVSGSVFTGKVSSPLSWQLSPQSYPGG